MTIILFISLSVGSWSLWSSDIQVSLEQPQILGFEHAIRLERDILCDYCEQEEYYKHGCLESTAPIEACRVALLEYTKLDEVASRSEIGDAVIEHDHDVEYHEAVVHRIRTAHQEQQVEQLVQPWVAQGRNQDYHHH